MYIGFWNKGALFNIGVQKYGKNTYYCFCILIPINSRLDFSHPIISKA